MTDSAQPFDAIDGIGALVPTDITPPQVADPQPVPPQSWHRLPDGRTLSYVEYGDPAGQPVLALHGTPGCRLKFASTGAVARNAGLRLICPDRWGYGGSDLNPRPGLGAFATDACALLDGLGVSRFAVVGISGGAPYAASIAAYGGDRATRLALVSPIGPLSGLPGHALRPFHRFSFAILPRVPGALTVVFRFYRRLLLLAPQATIVLASIGASAPDRQLIRSMAVRQRLAETFRVGLARHAAGAVCDLKLFGRPWPFELGSINCPARIWHGSLDRTVPFPAVQRLADGIPRAQLSVLEGEGHFWISRRYAEIYDWLADGAGSADLDGTDGGRRRLFRLSW